MQKRFVFLFFFVLMSSLVMSQSDQLLDSASVTLRQPSDSLLEHYRSMEDFNYAEEVEEPISFWDILVAWAMKIFFQIFSDVGAAPYIRYLLIFVAISFLIYMIISKRLNKIFYFNRNKKVGFNDENENIHELDFDILIEQHKQRQEYRQAIRYLFLKSLKILADKKQIDWQINKTNSDYYKEIEDKEKRKEFKRLTQEYEYRWYGNFFPKLDDYQQGERLFETFYNKIGG